ncbi:MAG: hypothetical protein G01um101429_306 [Parcubacteria group bacterium Gr01-1014_29]|nr:MAG: hypothetical protein G01um101429_306 [Parcubacteria group bacterium Gr01-1014_29]
MSRVFDQAPHNSMNGPDNKNQNLANRYTEHVLATFNKEYVVVGKTRVRSWHAWLIIGLAVGITSGVALVANRSGEFDYAGATESGRKKISVEGDYIVDTPGSVITHVDFNITGSVMVQAENVTFDDVKIICKGTLASPHSTDGLKALGVNRLKLKNMLIRGGCGGAGIFIQGGAEHDLAEGEIIGSEGPAIVLDNVSYSFISGWRTNENRGGIELRNGSHHNQLVASNVLRTRLTSKMNPFFISADSYENQIVRNRNRYPQPDVKSMVDYNPNNLWYHNVCTSAGGFAACAGNKDKKAPKNRGNPDDFKPRIRTVCTGHSFQGYRCEFNDIHIALAKANTGDVLIVDTKPGLPPSWPAITIDKPIWLIGNTRSQKGTYGFTVFFEDIIVKSSGVRLQNLVVKGLFSILADTTLVAVRTSGLKTETETEVED